MFGAVFWAILIAFSLSAKNRREDGSPASNPLRSSGVSSHAGPALVRGQRLTTLDARRGGAGTSGTISRRQADRRGSPELVSGASDDVVCVRLVGGASPPFCLWPNRSWSGSSFSICCRRSR